MGNTCDAPCCGGDGQEDAPRQVKTTMRQNKGSMNRYVANFKRESDHFDYAQNDTANFSTQEGLASGASNTLHFTRKYQNQAQLLFTSHLEETSPFAIAECPEEDDFNQDSILHEANLFNNSFTDASLCLEQPMPTRDPLVQKILVVLEYIQLELVTILPQILEASTDAISKFKDDEKKLNQTRRKLLKIIQNCKEEVYSLHQDESLNFVFDSCKKFDQFIKKQAKQNNEIESKVENIDQAIEYSLQNSKSEERLITITLDDPNMKKDCYARILSKYNAVTRYQIYQLVKQYAGQDTMGTISEDIMMQQSKKENQEKILREVFKLYDIKWDLDVFIAIRKLEYAFLKQEPIDEEFVSFVECLNEAHNQMILQIQNPSNRYRIMELNPIFSKDVMYGVPELYKEILNQIITQVDQMDQDEDGVGSFKNESSNMIFSDSFINENQVQPESQKEANLFSKKRFTQVDILAQNQFIKVDPRSSKLRHITTLRGGRITGNLNMSSQGPKHNNSVLAHAYMTNSNEE